MQSTEARKRKVKSILVTLPKPDTEKSPYYDLAKKYNVKVDFRSFIHVEGVPAKDFRTVSISQIHLPHGRTEIPVEIEVTAGFAARLSVRPPWDGVFSGYIRENDSIRLYPG